jgi:hypothetical protein
MDNKILEIYNIVKELTNNKKLEWKPFQQNRLNPLQTVIGDKSIRVTNSGSSISFQVFSGSKLIGTIADSKSNSNNLDLGEFWNKILRQAQGIDDDLDELLATLKKL